MAQDNKKQDSKEGGNKKGSNQGGSSPDRHPGGGHGENNR